MRFFSAAWHRGELAPEEEERVVPDYQAHLRQLKDSFPASLRTFVETKNLHDARVRLVQGDAKRGELRLELACGDRQQSYEHVFLRYEGVAEPTWSSLRSFRFDQSSEVLYDEIDSSDGGWVHRILLFPYAELEIHFYDFELSAAPLSNTGEHTDLWKISN